MRLQICRGRLALIARPAHFPVAPRTSHSPLDPSASPLALRARVPTLSRGLLRIGGGPPSMMILHPDAPPIERDHLSFLSICATIKK